MTQGIPEGQYRAFSQWEADKQHELAVRLLEAEDTLRHVCATVFQGVDVHPDNLRDVHIDLYTVIAGLTRVAHVITESKKERRG